MRCIILTSLLIVSAWSLPITLYSTVYLTKTSSELMQKPASDSPELIQCPTIYYGEKLVVVKEQGDWFKVLVAGGWSGWLRYRSGEQVFVAKADDFTRKYLTYTEALVSAEKQAKQRSPEAIPIVAYATDPLPSGLAMSWSIGFWLPPQEEFLIFKQENAKSEVRELDSFETVNGFDPFLYDHRGWHKTLSAAGNDSPAVMEAAWNILRSQKEQIKEIFIYRGPNPWALAATQMIGYIPPPGDELWYVRVNFTDQSYKILVFDLGGIWKGTATFPN